MIRHKGTTITQSGPNVFTIRCCVARGTERRHEEKYGLATSPKESIQFPIQKRESTCELHQTRKHFVVVNLRFLLFNLWSNFTFYLQTLELFHADIWHVEDTDFQWATAHWKKKKNQHILKTNFVLNEKVSEALSFEEPLCLRLQMMTSCTNSSWEDTNPLSMSLQSKPVASVSTGCRHL